VVQLGQRLDLLQEQFKLLAAGSLSLAHSTTRHSRSMSAQTSLARMAVLGIWHSRCRFTRVCTWVYAGVGVG
jgi:hypothetical protein